ncbi:type II toxin-antitoxin system RelB/DinJ family antitoxin [Hydrogenimonas thermophila]|uniref:Addiction module antitoxin, RelB/DinJ family n=1 Tax=Hydrogenimonas thermophila TaxID=223786 RepID=A0A1I5NAD1_9BACT|nr:type II toxin-antitoxin system RelB/DinJ family antitoxin [Hydrogenimonas thermophila]WOE69150.1 type II toxin-antitoxin system RelB/DinJ family antitoxin [Hydrogenimonas thermophila]WOE71660.1 type II toxin-antitoxin system RelB/DinJ family antitoxin [Hydrogenimonas thermophila]SFP18652.1 addiction module antitoxin, RelB/DinJ family [Hydrogenimonas thermophila]
MKIQTSVRVEERFYKEAKKVFDSFDLSFTDAVNIFLAKVAMEKKIPFELALPKDVEVIDKNDPDYKLIEQTRGEETIPLDEFMKL